MDLVLSVLLEKQFSVIKWSCKTQASVLFPARFSLLGTEALSLVNRSLTVDFKTSGPCIWHTGHAHSPRGFTPLLFFLTKSISDSGKGVYSSRLPHKTCGKVLEDGPKKAGSWACHLGLPQSTRRNLSCRWRTSRVFSGDLTWGN